MNSKLRISHAQTDGLAAVGTPVVYLYGIITRQYQVVQVKFTFFIGAAGNIPHCIRAPGDHYNSVCRRFTLPVIYNSLYRFCYWHSGIFFR